MSYRSIPQECPTRVSHKSVPQECPTRASYKSVPQECPTRVSHKSFLQECPTRVSYKSVLQECPRRKSHKSVLKSVIWTYSFFERVCIRVRGFHLVMCCHATMQEPVGASLCRANCKSNRPHCASSVSANASQPTDASGWNNPAVKQTLTQSQMQKHNC